MKKLKVMTIVGTRPEVIRLSRIISKMDDVFEHVLVHTGQNYDYELNEIFFRDLDLRLPDYYLNCAGSNSSQTIGNVLIKVDKLFTKIHPEAVLVLGDTNSGLSLIAAKKRKIPTFHYEAGNRCFDFRVPEEINRKIIDHTADVNITYSSIARNYLIKEGLRDDLIIKLGSPMYEVLNYYKNKINNSDILSSLNLNYSEYFLVSIHREENIETKNIETILKLLEKISKKYDLPIIFSTHPRTKKRISELDYKPDNNINFIKPFSFSEYNYLQINAKAVISDSGTISEESSILNFPAINLRENHERPEAMEEGAVIMSGINYDRVIQSLEVLFSQKRDDHRTLKIVDDYKVENVSEKIIRIILSYTDYIKREIWKSFV